MKKIIYIAGIVVSVCMMACSDEDCLSPSFQDRNWWVNVDDPDDPLDHLIFKVYDRYKIPVFYNDTVGMVQRGEDAFGNPDIYYEVIKLNYTILGGMGDVPVARYTLSCDRDDIMDGVMLLRDYVLPKFPDYIPVPKSYLLVDTLWRGVESDQQIPYSAAAYAGMTTVAVGKLGEIKNMTEVEKLMFGGEILAASLSDVVYNDYTAELNVKFYKEVQKLGKGYWGYSNKVDVNNTSVFYPLWAHRYEYGFLHPALDKEQVEGALYYFPNKEQDVADFVALCLGFTEDEVKEAYGQYEHIMNKYYYMMEIIDAIKAAKK